MERRLAWRMPVKVAATVAFSSDGVNKVRKRCGEALGYLQVHYGWTITPHRSRRLGRRAKRKSEASAPSVASQQPLAVDFLLIGQRASTDEGWNGCFGWSGCLGSLLGYE